MKSLLIAMAAMLLLPLQLHAAPQSCDMLEKQTFAFIDSKNYCDSDQECAVFDKTGCPFGCYHLINKKEWDAVQQKIASAAQAYDKANCGECKYDCMSVGISVTCDLKTHRCVDR